MSNVVYNRRKGVTAAYDQEIINLLNNKAWSVTVVDDAGVSGYDFSGVDLLVVGAPDTDWIQTHTANSTIAALDCHIISFCRGVSRTTFGMSTSSTTGDISQFTVENSDHPILQSLGWSSGAYDLGDSVTSHQVFNLSVGVDLVMLSGSTAGYAGLAEIMSGDKSRIHFGYHRFDVGNENLKSLFNNTLEYLGVDFNSGYGLFGAMYNMPLYNETLYNRQGFIDGYSESFVYADAEGGWSKYAIGASEGESEVSSSSGGYKVFPGGETSYIEISLAAYGKALLRGASNATVNLNSEGDGTKTSIGSSNSSTEVESAGGYFRMSAGSEDSLVEMVAVSGGEPLIRIHTIGYSGEMNVKFHGEIYIPAGWKGAVK